MEKNRGIHLVYKNLGETPNEAVLRFKKENLEYDFLPITYAGRLDPMAEGLLLLLSESAIKEKDKFLDLPKVYEFEILWGVETDTLDILGLITGNKKGEPEVEEVKKYLEKTKGIFEQMYPAYSSRPVGGKSLFQWAREGKISEIEIPKHKVEIFESSFVERRNISSKDLLEEVVLRVGLVKGDFRQEETISRWKEVLENSKEEYFLDKIYIKVSSGFYVRQFVSDLGREFGFSTTTFGIKRLSIGDFSV